MYSRGCSRFGEMCVAPEVAPVLSAHVAVNLPCIGDLRDTPWAGPSKKGWVRLVLRLQVAEAALSISPVCEISRVQTQVWAQTCLDAARESRALPAPPLGQSQFLGSRKVLSDGVDVPRGPA